MYVPPKRRQGSKLNPELLVQAQQMLDVGRAVPAISQVLGILPTTLQKAIDQGRLRSLKKKC